MNETDDPKCLRCIFSDGWVPRQQSKFGECIAVRHIPTHKSVGISPYAWRTIEHGSECDQFVYLFSDLTEILVRGDRG